MVKVNRQVTKYNRIADFNELGTARPKQIGLGRMITDRITFAYLTDLYILPAYSGRGLGSWLITVITELLTTWPECRRLMFLTNDKGKSFYEKIEKASLKELEFGKAGLVVMGRSYAGAFAPV
jgi:GNAT superfamily N-acetyltransferase